jgi:3-phenylpropionate/cinnamic acid dioxygenase small subunit
MRRDVEPWLDREAQWQDERRFHTWLDRFTEDVRYGIPVQRNRSPKESTAMVLLDPDR